MSPLLERLRVHWLAQNVAVNAGASEEEVAAFERAHGVALPPLFREYVRELNGMQDPGFDEISFSFRRLRVRAALPTWATATY